jgi:mRNA interferase MazF
LRRGELYWADLRPRSGSEQQGRRPVIIISHDGFNTTSGWASIIIVPCSTSDAQRRRGLTTVALTQGTGGLPANCVALCHQITTLDRSKLTQRIGALSESDLLAVEDGIKAAIDLS